MESTSCCEYLPELSTIKAFTRFAPQVKVESKTEIPLLEKKPALVLTKTKLVRAPNTVTVTKPNNQKRRNSVKSKFKIVHNKSCTPIKRPNSKISRYKLDNRSIKSFNLDTIQNKISNRFKRSNAMSLRKIKSLVKTVQASRSLVKINGVMYKKSKNSLKRISVSKVNTRKLSNIVMQSKYKLVKKTLSKKNDNMKQKIKVLRKQQSPLKTKELISRKKLKVCNIPCPFYQKYGICQKKDTGKCFRKHDPAQIALCTRFLQGACLKEKCLLSHRVSPEKMPTCKFYLEDSCIKENCPYLHVKLSQNAEICRDFLEGFCKEAAECKRRHQYLCPDFEKYGNCPKQRCPYPHGNMVRSYLIHKHKFTTNYSKKTKLNTEKLLQIKTTSDKNEEKQRYYIRHNSLESSISKKNSDSPNKNIIELHSRPKLGNLPSFIPLNE